MTFLLRSLVHETTGVWAGGVGPIPLAGAVAANRFRFGQRYANAQTALVAMWDEDQAQEFEALYFAANDELIVGEIKASTNGGAPVSWAVNGVQNVAVAAAGDVLAGIVDPGAQVVGLLRRTGTDRYDAVADPLPIANGGTGVDALADVYAALGVKEIRANVAEGAAADHPDSLIYQASNRGLRYSDGSTWAGWAIEDGSVSEPKLADGAVGTAALGSGAVGVAQLAAGIATEGGFAENVGPVSPPSSLSWVDVASLDLNDAGGRILFFVEWAVATSSSLVSVRIVRASDGLLVSDDGGLYPDVGFAAEPRGTWLATSQKGGPDTYKLQVKRYSTSQSAVYTDVRFAAIVARAN